MSVQQAGTDIRVLRELEEFPLVEALFGRRSRRFARGAMGGTTCVAREAQYVFDTFGKFPGTVPSVFIMNYVQARHLDPGSYDRFFKPGAYLRTHAEHMQR
jgi:hypothetical protein